MARRTIPDISEPILAKFRLSYIQDDNGCWVWIKLRSPRGYGIFSFHNKNWQAHRVSYYLATGRQIDAGMVTTWDCGNASCVNPDHLQLASNVRASQIRFGGGRDHSPLDGEEWKTIPWGNNDYEASTYGRIRHGGYIMLGNPDKNGYPLANLIAGPKKLSTHAHILVALAFLGPRPKGHQVAHGDGDPANNKLSNLRYCTPLENIRDKWRHGTMPLGEQLSWSKLTEANVKHIRSSYVPRDRERGCRGLARKFGVHEETIRRVLRFSSWTHI